MTGVGICQRVELIPEKKRRIARKVYPGATPIRLMKRAVEAGEKMTMYRITGRSAMIPIKGLNRDGIRCITASSPVIP
jgi:hypothetical protein